MAPDELFMGVVADFDSFPAAKAVCVCVSNILLLAPLIVDRLRADGSSVCLLFGWGADNCCRNGCLGDCATATGLLFASTGLTGTFVSGLVQSEEEMK